MNIELIVIGDEVLNGRTKDKNASWLTEFLFKNNFQLNNIQFIRDNSEEIEKAISLARKRSQLILTSGGLGPTLDDITKKAIADIFNKEIGESHDAEEVTRDNYLRYGRVWSKDLNFYHHFPKDFIPLKNPKGLAPGLYYNHQNETIIASAPGVPREFQSMVAEVIIPQARKDLKLDGEAREILSIKTHGVIEEKMYTEVAPTLWKQLEELGKVSSLPGLTGVDIVVIYNPKKVSKQHLIKTIEDSPLAPFVWQYGEMTLPELIIEKAKEKNLKLGFAESCTGGLSASLITDISGSSSVFWGSVVSYSNEVKMNVLGVKEKTLIDHGAVSSQTAYEMAEGARKALCCDIAVSFSGIAGPGGGSDEKPVGTVAIGVSTSKETQAEIYHFKGDRIRLKNWFAVKGLMLMLKTIENL